MTVLLVALALADAPTVDADALLDEARRRAVIGDFEGMRLVAEEALQSSPAVATDAQYLLAIGWEYDGRPERALEIYDALLADAQPGDFQNDLFFRRAESLGRSHRYSEALQQLGEIPDEAVTRPADQLKVSILESLWLLESSSRREERLGLENLIRTLDNAAVIDAPPYQAMGRARLAELATGEAARLAFKGSKKKKAKRLQARAALVQTATDELVAMVPLEVPAPTLQTFLIVGQGYVQFGQALLDESRVRGLSADQRVLYETERQARVEGVWVNASRYFDRGLEYSQRVGWVGPEVQALRLALTDIVQQTEALASP